MIAKLIGVFLMASILGGCQSVTINYKSNVNATRLFRDIDNVPFNVNWIACRTNPSNLQYIKFWLNSIDHQGFRDSRINVTDFMAHPNKIAISPKGRLSLVLPHSSIKARRYTDIHHLPVGHKLIDSPAIHSKYSHFAKSRFDWLPSLFNLPMIARGHTVLAHCHKPIGSPTVNTIEA